MRKMYTQAFKQLFGSKGNNVLEGGTGSSAGGILGALGWKEEHYAS